MAILKVGGFYFNSEDFSSCYYADGCLSIEHINGRGVSELEGEEALALKRWLDKNSFDVMEE